MNAVDRKRGKSSYRLVVAGSVAALFFFYSFFWWSVARLNLDLIPCARDQEDHALRGALGIRRVTSRSGWKAGRKIIKEINYNRDILRLHAVKVLIKSHEYTWAYLCGLYTVLLCFYSLLLLILFPIIFPQCESDFAPFCVAFIRDDGCCS